MGAWDGFESTAQENQFVQLKEDGDEFEGVIASIEPHVIPKDTFDYQPEDLTVPRVTFEDGKVYDATTTVVRNAFIELSPEPGTRVKIKRVGKPKGKKYVLYTVTEVTEAPKRTAKGVDSKEEF